MHKTHQKTLVMSRKNSYTVEVAQINKHSISKNRENKRDDFDIKSKSV